MSKVSMSAIIDMVVDQVSQCWKLANITTKTHWNMKKGLEKILKKRENLVKMLKCKKVYEKEIQNRREFEANLVPPGGFKSWLAPGATHKARFMNFGIYAMKMYLFSDQLGYTMEVVNGLQRMATYISLIYARFFLNASVGADAPVNDLDLHKQLFSFQSHDADLANKSLEILSRHGWYLDQTIVPFAFFSEKVSMEEKTQLAKKMLSFAPKSENPEFEIQRQRFPEVLPNTKLEDLLVDRSFLIFSLLKIGYGWLSTPVDDWEDSLDYVKAQTFVRTAKTVNVVAERAVKVMTDYSNILTKDDATRQLIMQGVAENRRLYNNFNKKTLNKKNLTK